MLIEVASKRRKVTRPDAVVIDVTSRGPDPWVRFSPFYPPLRSGPWSPRGPDR